MPVSHERFVTSRDYEMCVFLLQSNVKTSPLNESIYFLFHFRWQYFCSKSKSLFVDAYLIENNNNYLAINEHIMSILSEKFHEQYSRLQEQFDEWTPMEQFYALLGLSRKLQISYRYFLSQLLSQTNNQSDNKDMFHHTIHQANTPGKNSNLHFDQGDNLNSCFSLQQYSFVSLRILWIR